MKNRLVTMAALTFGLVAQAHAEKNIAFSVSPTIGHSFGKTEYVLLVRGYDVDDSGEIIVDESGNPVLFRLKSQLEYPMDVILVGADILIQPTNDTDAWSVKTGVATNLTDPGGIMKDSDWLGATGYYDLTKFSYTESDARLNSFLLNIEATLRILTPGKLSISLLAGGRYHRIEQTLFGIDGWQIHPDSLFPTFGTPRFFDVLEDTEVLYYKVKYLLPRAGLLASGKPAENLTIRTEATLTAVWFKDVDDHPLRTKLSEADGTGIGFIGSISGRYLLGSPTQNYRPFCELFSELTSLTASGDQTQTWYGDADPDTEKGTVIRGVPHDVSATLYHVGVKLGMNF